MLIPACNINKLKMHNYIFLLGTVDCIKKIVSFGMDLKLNMLQLKNLNSLIIVTFQSISSF